MSSNITVEVRQAFDGYLATMLPSIGLTTSSVSWFNVNFQPISTELYLRPRLLFGETFLQTYGLGGNIRTSGLYQIDVLGVPNKGVKQLEDMGQKVINIFPTGSRIKREKVDVIIRTAYSGAYDMEDLRPILPVTIDWTMLYERDMPLDITV